MWLTSSTVRQTSTTTVVLEASDYETFATVIDDAVASERREAHRNCVDQPVTIGGGVKCWPSTEEISSAMLMSMWSDHFGPIS